MERRLMIRICFVFWLLFSMRGIYTHFDRACYWLYTRSDGLRLCFGLRFVFSMRVIYIYIVYTERRLTNSLFVVLFVALPMWWFRSAQACRGKKPYWERRRWPRGCRCSRWINEPPHPHLLRQANAFFSFLFFSCISILTSASVIGTPLRGVFAWSVRGIYAWYNYMMRYAVRRRRTHTSWRRPKRNKSLLREFLAT